MTITVDPRLPDVKDPTFRLQLTQVLRTISQSVISLSQTRLAGTVNASSAAPTAGAYQKGDVVRNNAPAESGASGSKYLVTGWICTVATTPTSAATFLPMRVLTGN